MRAVVQRVSRAKVIVGEETTGEIGPGLLVYVGIGDDGPNDVHYLADKIRHLRIFQDEQDKMNLDVAQAGGAVLVVSNFTLLADARKGRRPAFTQAADPQSADRLYQMLCEELRAMGVPVQTGRFGALMSVDAANDGPINILLDSKRLF
jgi:D-tyrosyl-tRNA(Tyr) deacylase